MKANELMIGDWVVSNKRGKKEILKVISIDGGTNCCWLDAGCYSGLVACEDISPIPLTAEILEKNGFVFREDNDIMCGEYYLHNQSTFAIKMFNGYLVGMCMREDLEFHCVHELQHALRLCGLNELANNFKV